MRPPSLARRPARLALPALLSLLGACATRPAPAAEQPVAAPPAAASVAAPAAEPAAPPPIPIPDLERRLARLCDALEADRQRLHVPGMALAIVKDGDVLLARGFGSADLETERPVDEETLFAIGSSTKAFTATLIGMLVDEGKMAWDAPLATYLPDYRPQIQSTDPQAVLTVRDALSHRSGFSRNDVLWAAGLASRAEILAAAARAEPTAAFRAEFHYNNVMVMAAGEAAARVAGTTWEELVLRRIFAPLGMRDSDTSVREAERDPRLARGYWWNDETQAFERLPMRPLEAIAPAGAINSNARDMAQWLRFLLARGTFGGQRLVGAQRLEETWTPAIEMTTGASYGLCWMLRDWLGHRVVEHGGNIDGFAAEVALLPDANVGFVLLTNVSATPLQASAQERVWNALLGDLPPETEAGVVGAAASTAEDFAPYLGTYLGNFAQFQDARFVVEVQNGRLAVDVPGQMVFELLPPDAAGKRAFALVPDQIQVSFARAEDGAVLALRIDQGGATFELPREGVEQPLEVPLDELGPYLGAYREADGKTMQVLVQNRHLALDYPGQQVYELRPPDAQGRWAFRMTPELALEFHRGEDGRVQSLTFHERGTERLCPRTDIEGLEALPTLDDLLHLRDAGDFERRLDELGPCRMKGTIRFVHAGAEGTVESLFDADGRSREDVDLGPFGSLHVAVDGEHGATLSSFEPYQELSGKFLDEQRISHPAALLGDWSAHFDSVEVVRTALEDGRRAYVVRLKKGELEPLLVFVDAETGDLVRVEEHELDRGAGSVPRTRRLEDWRDVAGLRLPFRQTTEDEGSGRVVVQMESFEAGVEPAPDAFVLHKE